MYARLFYLHLVGINGFLLAHGASASAAVGLRRGGSLERVHPLVP